MATKTSKTKARPSNSLRFTSTLNIDVWLGSGNVSQKSKNLARIKNSTKSDTHSLLEGLEKELSQSASLKKAWEQAKLDLAERRADPKRKVHFSKKHDDSLYLVLFVYCYEEPNFYSEFNRLCREIRSEEEAAKFPYRHYFKLLLRSIKEVVGKPKSVGSNQIYYRGIQGNCEHIKQGERIMFQQFLSTSRDLQTAESFARGGTLLAVEGMVFSGFLTGTVLGLKGNPTMTNLDHIDVVDPEYETLIWPFEGFKVKKITQVNDGMKVIHLKA